MDLKTDRTLDVIAMGRASVDFVPDTYGSTATEHQYTKFLGGSPANTAVSMAQHRIRTGYIGKVGEDILGDYLISYMSGKGIDTSHILRCGDPAVRTGLSVAERMGPNRKRSNLYRCDVADLHMLPEEMDEAYIAQAGILLVSGASLSDSPAREAMFLAVEYARRSGVLVAFDPDYRAQSWHSELQTSVYYDLMMGLCDILITTREEMDVLEKAFLPGNGDDGRSARRCFERGVSIVLIKHGEDGSTAFTADGRTVVQKAFPSRVISLQGAGDSYSGAFLAELTRGADLAQAMEYASASAALTVSGRSCSEHMPSREMTLDFIQTCKSGRVDQWQWWE